MFSSKFFSFIFITKKWFLVYYFYYIILKILFLFNKMFNQFYDAFNLFIYPSLALSLSHNLLAFHFDNYYFCIFFNKNKSKNEWMKDIFCFVLIIIFFFIYFFFIHFSSFNKFLSRKTKFQFFLNFNIKTESSMAIYFI